MERVLGRYYDRGATRSFDFSARYYDTCSFSDHLSHVSSLSSIPQGRTPQMRSPSRSQPVGSRLSLGSFNAVELEGRSEFPMLRLIATSDWISVLYSRMAMPLKPIIVHSPS